MALPAPAQRPFEKLVQEAVRYRALEFRSPVQWRVNTASEMAAHIRRDALAADEEALSLFLQMLGVVVPAGFDLYAAMVDLY